MHSASPVPVLERGPLNSAPTRATTMPEPDRDDSRFTRATCQSPSASAPPHLYIASPSSSRSRLSEGDVDSSRGQHQLAIYPAPSPSPAAIDGATSYVTSCPRHSPSATLSFRSTPRTHASGLRRSPKEIVTLERRVTDHSQPASPGVAQPGAYYALVMLILMNLLNYSDRFAPSACKALIQRDLRLSDVETALPMGAFLTVYMLTAPIFGYLADHGRVRRVPLLVGGLLLWSVATVAGAFSQNFAQLLLARAAVGIGEAAYATIAPVMLCDFFPVAQRARVLSYFYLACPCGAAVGYVVAGQVGARFGWRPAFLVCGVPGLALTFFAAFMREPRRGQQDRAPVPLPTRSDEEPNEAAAVAAIEEGASTTTAASAASAETTDVTDDELPISWAVTLRTLAHNPTYRYTLLASTLVSFASGGIADWLPTWLTRAQGLGIGDAGLLFGIVTCVSGVAGLLFGHVFCDALSRRGVRNSYFAVAALTQTGAGLFVALMLATGNMVPLEVVVLFLSLCQLCLWLNVGGCSAALANCVPVRIRSRAFAINILVSHLGGDAISPALVGAISDAHDGDLTRALILVPAAFVASAIVFAVAQHNVRAVHDPCHEHHHAREQKVEHNTTLDGGTAVSLLRVHVSLSQLLAPLFLPQLLGFEDSTLSLSSCPPPTIELAIGVKTETVEEVDSKEYPA